MASRLPWWPRHPAFLSAAVVIAASGGWATSAGGGPAPLPGLATHADYAGGADLPSDSAWIGGGDVPGVGTRWEEMSRLALRDLHHLTPAPPVFAGPAAGAAEPWRLTWPRDAGFTAVAMAQTGRAPEALTTLAFLQGVQREDGGFAARYQVNGEAAPDRRPAQSDGSGWALWALESVSAAAAPGAQVVVLRRFRRLLDRASEFAVRQTERPGGLPAPSSDYWEHREGELTLGTAAPLLAGLRAAGRMYGVLGDRERARRADGAAAALEERIIAVFGPGGYQRYARRGGTDAAVTFLAPPFVWFADSAGVAEGLQDYQRTARRVSGGLAPGAGWRDDGISWTPETALVALGAAAAGDRRTAEYWLDWLDDQRVAWGSLPEKVRPDGLPAGPAPLAWTASLVIMTLVVMGPARTAPALSAEAVEASIADIDRLSPATN